MTARPRARTAKTKGANDAVLRSQRSLARSEVDPQGLLTPDVVQRHIDAGTCPFCPSGPFVLLGIHTNRAHGVSARELKEMGGLWSTASTASPESTERRRAAALEYGFGAMSPPAGSEPRRRAAPKIGEAGKKRARERPEEVAAFRSRMMSPEVEAKRAAVLAAKHQGHGTVASYKRGCRCHDCYEAKNAPRRTGRPVGRPPKAP